MDYEEGMRFSCLRGQFLHASLQICVWEEHSIPGYPFSLLWTISLPSLSVLLTHCVLILMDSVSWEAGKSCQIFNRVERKEGRELRRLVCKKYRLLWDHLGPRFLWARQDSSKSLSISSSFSSSTDQRTNGFMVAEFPSTPVAFWPMVCAECGSHQRFTELTLWAFFPAPSPSSLSTSISFWSCV